MLRKRKRGTAGVAVATMVTLVLACTGTAGAATPRYPDLRTLTPSEIHLGTETVGAQTHHVVRFTNVVWNSGEGPLELHGTPHFPLDGLFDATQWIYESPAGVTQQPVGTFAYHAEHSHFHFDDFARYELWSRRAFERASSRGFATGQPIAVSPKVTFCVYDAINVASALPTGVYKSCTPVLEGLSAGWGDEYDWLMIGQWLDVGASPLPDGDYVIRSIADPSNRIFESAGKLDPTRESQVANSAAARFTVVNGQLAP